MSLKLVFNKTLALSMLICSASFFIVGCGGHPSTVPVSGIVTYQDKPLEGANVVFSRETGDANKGEIAMGKTDASGRFELTTHFGSQATANGAVPGKYNVSISKHIPPNGMTFEKYQAMVEAAAKIEENGAMVPPNQQPPPTTEMLPNHATAGKSPINAEVPPGGTKDLNFPIK